MKVEIFKVWFKLAHGGYGIDFICQERIDMYVQRGRIVLRKEPYYIFNPNTIERE